MALEKEFAGVATYVIKSSGKNVEELSTQQAVAMKDFIATSEETQIMMLEHAVSQRHNFHWASFRERMGINMNNRKKNNC